jgi:hypothetical protein
MVDVEPEFAVSTFRTPGARYRIQKVEIFYEMKG